MDVTIAQVFDGLGWAVIHSLWQGLIAAAAVFLFRSATKNSQASLRCGFELLALTACFTAFVTTFVLQLGMSSAGAASPSMALADLFAPTTSIETGAIPAGLSEAAPSAAVANYAPLFGLLWFVGFLGLAMRYAYGFMMTRRLRTRGISAAPLEWQRRFETLVLNTGIFRKVTLHISDRINGPVTLGFFKPVVLVPASFFSGLPASQIEAILMHEIAHIRRHDYFINLLQTAAKTVLFFHPAIHYICRFIDEDREQACDDFAVNFTQDPDSLIKGLAALRLDLAPPNFAMAAGKQRKPLLRRLTRLSATEDTRSRPEQAVTSLAALIIAAGLYIGTNVEFANAHPPTLETETINLNDNHGENHVDADKQNYWFNAIRHNGRNITVKNAESGTRWVKVASGWADIDKNPQVLNQVPSVPLAPKMPRPEGFTSHKKFEKSAKQYRIDLDYYIASLENDACRKCTKSKLHWANKQKQRVSNPSPDFDKDLIWKETENTFATPANPAPKPTPKPEPLIAPRPDPKPQAVPSPPAIVKTGKTAELAGAPKLSQRPANSTLYLNGKKYDADAWGDATEDKIERISDRFESKMERIEDDFERALDKFETAAERFAEDPTTKKAAFEKAQQDFAKSVLSANAKRDALSAKFDQEISRIVDQQVSAQATHINHMVERETEQALKAANIAAENALQMQKAKTHHKTHHKMHHKTSHTQSGHRSTISGEPIHKDYGKVMLAQLGNDGIIPHGSNSVSIQYKDGDMYVNGARVNSDVEKEYCSINSAFNLKKSDDMRIEISYDRLTITDYNN